jgi:AcrR family transcriptional regulator
MTCVVDRDGIAGVARVEVAEIQRVRIMQAIVEVVAERGYAGASVTVVCERAQLPRRAFYEVFDSREHCFAAVLDDGYRQVWELIAGAVETAECWQDGVRAVLCAVLSFFDEHPELTRVWLIESLSAGSWVLERRARNLKTLTQVIVRRWPTPAGLEELHPVVSVGVMGSIIGVIQAHILSAEPEPLITLLGLLMGLATAPYLDVQAVAVEMRHAERIARQRLAERPPVQKSLPGPAPGSVVPSALLDPRAHRARRCLSYLAAHPNASNRQVADGIGVAGHEQISRLLARLAGMSLLTKHPGAPGHTNSWTLTPSGAQISRALEAVWDGAGHDGELS